MDLLNNKQADQDSSMKEKIFNMLRKMRILPENMKIAEKFFNFSKELDTELLKNIVNQDLSNSNYSGVAFDSKNFMGSCEYNLKEYLKYSDRYILFLDAVGGNTIVKFLSNNFAYEFITEYTALSKIMRHAYSMVYTDDEIEAKVAALIAEESYDSVYNAKLFDIAEKNPSTVFKAGKYFCHSQNIYSKIILLSLALEYSYLNALNNKPTIDDESINYACDIIYECAENQNVNYKETYLIITAACFKAVHYSEKIKTVLRQAVNRKETWFFKAILNNTSEKYLAKNLDVFADLVDLKNKPSLILEFIKEIVTNHCSSDGIINRISRLFLKYAAQNYPEQYISAMRSTRKASYEIVVCDDYEQLYKILKTYNPQSIEKYNVNIDEDILQFATYLERQYTNKYKDEVMAYLRGEKTMSDIKDILPDLALQYNYNTRTDMNQNLINYCLSHNSKFRNRYIAIKSIQCVKVVNYKIQDNKLLFEQVVSSLASEKVPISFRFSIYEQICELTYDEKEQLRMEKLIAKEMNKHSSEFASEYDSFCEFGLLFTRKAYLRYLELSNKDDCNKEKLLAFCKDNSKEVRALLIQIISRHKNYDKEVLEMLKSKKASMRETAVDILSTWGVKNYEDILISVAENEKSKKLADKIYGMFNVEITLNKDKTVFSPIVFVDSIHKGGRAKKVQWLYETPNATVHFKNGNVADDKYIQAILLCYADMSELGVNENAALLAQELNQQELNKYVETIFSKWTAQGAEAKKKWVLYFCAIHGEHNMIEVLLNYIKEWTDNSRGAIASEAVRAIACNGSSEALMSVDNIAHKFKHKQVKNAAVKALDDAAEQLGITSDELGDRIVPDLGFDENMERVFDYGTRKFKVYLTPTLELEVFDENNKKLKTLPSPAKKDDEIIAKQSNTEFKAMKKQLKNVVSIQKLRLETALLADRRWTVENWNNLFVKNPVMHSFAIGLIWAAYENDNLVQTFRYMEDGTFNTADEDEYELPENCTIGLVHPIDLSEDELSTWKEQLSDYEITQPIEQLERTVYCINEDEIGQLDFNRFRGRTINGMTLLGRMTKMGWYKGSVQDAGCFYTFYREDITKRFKDKDGKTNLVGNAVELNFSGMYVGGDDEEVTIENIRFYKPGTVKRGSYEYDEPDEQRTITPDKINPRYLSEIINQIETILK